MVAVPGHNGFNEALQHAGTDLVTRHVDDAPNTTEFHLAWSIPAATGQVLAIRLSADATAADKTTAHETQTFYTLTTSDVTVASTDLIAPAHRAALANHITDALREKSVLDEDASVDADKAFTDIILTPKHEAIAVITPDAAPLTPKKSVAVSIPAALVEPALSADGKRIVAGLPALSKADKNGETAAAAPASFAGLTNGAVPAVRAPRPAADDAVDCSAVPCVALTYDDGPSEYTPQLLDVLHAHDVHATFFTIGRQIEAHPDALKREAAEGHAVGIHTWTHPDLTKVSDPQIAQEITSTADKIASLTGTRPSITRPPYGSVNDRVIGQLKNLGQGIILWNVDTEDWRNKNSRTVLARATANPHAGQIILMHDSHSYGPEATGEIIDFFTQRGYHFVTIPQMFGDDMTPGTRYFGFTDRH
nr:polysaccharide deacetylase family protein [Nanchangia anserum]